MEWLNQNSDALMVIITFVYVIATIFIWRANKNSAKASNDQLEESKRQFEEQKLQFEEQKRQFEESKNQYEETLRLQCMPFLQMEYEIGAIHQEAFALDLPFYDSGPTSISTSFFVLKNLGNGTAINLKYSWDFNDSEPTTDSLPICAIKAGDEYIIKVLLKPFFTFSFSDLRGVSYLQKIYIYYDYLNGCFACNNCIPTIE